MMLERLAERLTAAGLARYEISSFARPGRRRATTGATGSGAGARDRDGRVVERAGLGRRAPRRAPRERALARRLPGAHRGRRPGRRGRARAARPGDGARRGRLPGAAHDAGLDAAAFAAEFGAPPRAFWPEAIDEALAAGWLVEGETGALRLTGAGILLSDTLFARLV
jgi:coproporphyrinogen III oxidase-like Fe-S oxidoreductase